MCEYFILNLSFYFLFKARMEQLSLNLKVTNQERLLLKQWRKLSNLGLFERLLPFDCLHEKD
jgi:hypothetical protein